MRKTFRIWTWVLALLIFAGALTLMGAAGKGISSGGAAAYRLLQDKVLHGEQLSRAEKLQLAELNRANEARNPHGSLDNSGGPDATGYRFVDSVTPDTATFSWIELCGDASATDGPVGDDAGSAALSLGFTFAFYGTNYTQCYVSTNGLISFGALNSGYSSSDPATTTPTNPYIAPYWNDMSTDETVNGGCNNDQIGPWIRYRSFGTYFVAEWKAVPTYNNDDLVTFEAILYPSGAVKVQFGSNFVLPTEPSHLGNVTVGIDGAGANNGVRYWYWPNGGPAVGITPAASRAIWFYPGQPLPPAPTNLTVTPLLVARKDSLHWDVSPDTTVDEYKLYRRQSGQTTWNVRQTIRGRALNWVRDTVETDGGWEFAVTALDTNASPVRESAYSNVVMSYFGHLPPLNLTVNGNHDDRYHLAWVAAGTPQERELFYDDGANSPAIGGIGFNGAVTFGWFVSHFHTTAGPATVTQIKVFFTHQAIDGDAFQIGVFADSGNGTPTLTPLGVVSLNHAAPYDAFQTWTLTTPVTIPSGSFFIGVRQVTASNVSVGGDQVTPFINNTFFYNGAGAAWTTFEPNLPVIPLIRCFASGSFAAFEELAPAPVDPTAYNYADRSTIAALAPLPSIATTYGMSPAAMAASIARSVAPHASYAEGGVTIMRGHNSLDDVTRYLIYKDNAVLDSVASTDTTYDNVTGSTHENQPHSFFVRARYDDNLLSASTDTVSNAVYNMAPGRPTAVAMHSLNDTTLQITWTDPVVNADTTTCVDLAGIRIYRDATLITTTPVAPGVGHFDHTPPDLHHRYTYYVRGIDEVPNEGASATVTGSVLGVSSHGGALPTVFALHANFPNPFNPTTVVPFDVPQTSHVDIFVYNVLGQEVAHPVNANYSAGRYDLHFNGVELPSGLYLVRMKAGSFSAMQKMMMLK